MTKEEIKETLINRGIGRQIYGYQYNKEKVEKCIDKAFELYDKPLKPIEKKVYSPVFEFDYWHSYNTIAIDDVIKHLEYLKELGITKFDIDEDNYYYDVIELETENEFLYRVEEDIEELMKEIYKNEEEIKDAKIALLQAEIDKIKNE